MLVATIFFFLFYFRRCKSTKTDWTDKIKSPNSSAMLCLGTFSISTLLFLLSKGLDGVSEYCFLLSKGLDGASEHCFLLSKGLDGASEHRF